MLILPGFPKNHLSDCCMVYESRPNACREYLYTDRKRFIQILSLSHKDCETCLVVHEIFEGLKNSFPTP